MGRPPKKAPPEVQGCGCWRKADAELRKAGMMLPYEPTISMETHLISRTERAEVRVQSLKTRGKPLRVLCAFCPFCGRKYETDS